MAAARAAGPGRGPCPARRRGGLACPRPGLLRPAAEYLATAATGRPVVIGGARLPGGGRPNRDRGPEGTGRTDHHGTGEHLARRDAVARERRRGPLSERKLHRPLSCVDRSLPDRPRRGFRPWTRATPYWWPARRSRSDRDGPPPLARLLIVPRILLGLGLERLVLHSGELEYRGRSSTRDAPRPGPRE